MATIPIRHDPAPAADQRSEGRNSGGTGNPCPASPAQKRSWFLSRLHGDTHAFNISRAYWVQGEVDIGRLERSLGGLLRRHEILRSSFNLVGDRLVQVVQPGVRFPIRTFEVQPEAGGDPAAAALESASRSARQPIDPGQYPLFRCEVYRLGARRQLLTLVFHRMLVDDQSIDLLVRQLASVYEGLLSEEPTMVPPGSVSQYGEFACWQQEQLQRGLLKEDLAHWVRHLPHPLPVLELPLDHARPPILTFAGARRRRTLPAEVAIGITKLSEAEGTHPAVSLLATFQVFLHRYTAQEEIMVGVCVDGRRGPRTSGLVGPLENILPMTATFTKDDTFRELLLKAARAWVEAQAHQDAPFEALIEELEPERSLSVPSLCQALFSFDSATVPAPHFAGSLLVPVDLESVTLTCELKLNAAPTGQGLALSLDYNRELFDGPTIDRMLAQLEVLLRGVIASPEADIRGLPLLTESECDQLFVRWNETTRNYPREKCLHQLFEESAQRTPGAIAVECCGQRLTYRELNAQADGLAARLCGVGVGPETIVPLCAERSLEMVIGVLGILKSGGAYLPLDPIYPRERLWSMLDDSRARVIVIQPHLREILAGQKAALIYLEPNGQLEGTRAPKHPVVSATPENPAYVMYTSGSTGRPKGVVVTHRNVVHSTYARFLAYDQRVESFLMPYSHAFDSSVAGMFWTLCQGGRLVLPSVGQEKNPPELARLISQTGVSHLDCLPSLYRLLLECGRAEALSSLRVVIVGGEACPPELPCEHQRLLPHVKLYNEYGPTECTVWSTVYPMGEALGGTSVPIGRPIANTQAYILDAHRQAVPLGVPGELYLGGDGVARGYLNQLEQTAERFVPNPFAPERSSRLYRTGDRVRYRPDGNIEYLGRTDRQVKVRGFRIEVGEIEAALASHPAVCENTVIAREDAPGVKRLVAYVRCRGESSGTELRAFLKARLPEYMVPSAFVFLDSFPRTPNGKVDPKLLPAPSTICADVNTALSCPTNTLQAQLVELWERMLGVHPIGIRSNFFELGGDSLLAARLYLEIESQFGKTLPLATFFPALTIERLAEVIGQKADPQAWSSLVAVQPQGSRPPLFMVAATGGNVIGYEPLARRLGLDQPVYGLQSWGLSGRHPPHTRIEEMAAHYIAEIQVLQPQGPYFLSGLSFGGVVAFEMAQQLHAQGQPVGLVALLDTDFEGKLDQLSAWQSMVRRIYLMRQRLDAHVDQLRRLRRSDVGTYLQGKALILRSRLKNQISENAYKLHEKGGASLSSFLQNVRAANHLALRRYRPKVYAGPLTLIRAALPSADKPKWHPWAAWSLLAAGGLRVHYLPGDHISLLQEPYVKVVAEKLRESIDEVLERKTNDLGVAPSTKPHGGRQGRPGSPVNRP